MIDLQHPINVTENFINMKKIENKYKKGEEIMLEDKLKYYEAKANLFLKKFEDSKEMDGIALMKAENAIFAYDDLDDSESKWKRLI